MTINEVKNKIDSIKEPSQYLRVSESHPLELYLGKNEKNLVTLRFNGIFTPVKVVSTNLIEVKQVKTTNYFSILFIFNSSENLTLFYRFCEDMINQTEDFAGDDAYKEIVNRYNQWKKMFSINKKNLNENEVLGLIGELLFLKDYAFVTYGITDSLNAWSGPEPTHKDFSYKNEWYEIKSISSFKRTVSISSLEQLDSELDGHLVIYYFEKMSPKFSGITLNKLVTDIVNSLKYDSDRDIFFSKLKQAGYSYNEVYDEFMYSFIKREKYLVNREFPRIKAESLPKGIGKVQYEILINLIEKYLESEDGTNI